MRKHLIAVVITTATLAIAHTVANARQESRTNETKATPMLWQDPGEMGARDLFWGMGSADRAPQPSFTSVEEDAAGTKPKVIVTDGGGSGAQWTAIAAGTCVHSIPRASGPRVSNG